MLPFMLRTTLIARILFLDKRTLLLFPGLQTETISNRNKVLGGIDAFRMSCKLHTFVNIRKEAENLL